MQARSAQLTLVCLALAAISVVCLVFITGRLWHFPLDYSQQEEIPLAQMAVPPFFAVLGTAANYLRAPMAVKIKKEHESLLRLLVWAPSILFLFLFAIISASFHVANQPGSETYFSLDSYRAWLTICLSMISVSVPAVSAVVFRSGAK